jgi:hypothetical protein
MTEKEILALCHKAGFKTASVEFSTESPDYKVNVGADGVEYGSKFSEGTTADNLKAWLDGLKGEAA